jgi:phenylpropionate dioxygenase-like ring-hydroxylating dioxygenase large terminal subunit
MVGELQPMAGRIGEPIMFINNWYAACIASELGRDPVRVRMLGCDFVLFRDFAGAAYCLSDVCCHRGASLAIGKRRDDLIVCPQHGWEYDCSGKCVRIPAGTREPDSPPKRARVPSYPVQEKYGLVFAFLGDLGEAQRPAIPDILPEREEPDTWRVGMIARKKDINYLRMSENYNDPCHVNYVHEFAKWLPVGVTIETIALTDTYLKAFHAAWDAKGGTSPERGLTMEYSVIGNMSRNTQRVPNYPTQIVLAVVTPIDEHSSQIFMQLLQRTDSSTAEQHQAMVDMTRDQVMDEDYAVLKTTRPVRAASPAEELLVESDLTVAQVRKMAKDYAERYGEIDIKAFDELRETHVRVIPCPGHRADPKNWVHRTVPLVDRSAAARAKGAKGDATLFPISRETALKGKG